MNRAQRRQATPHIRTRRVVEPAPFGPGLNAHWRVAKIAAEMANEMWEQYAAVNEIYHRLRAEGKVSEADARRFFVERVGPRLLEQARIALTDMLTQPDHLVPASMKNEISEALILDSDLRARRIVADDRLMGAPVGMMH